MDLETMSLIHRPPSAPNFVVMLLPSVACSNVQHTKIPQLCYAADCTVFHLVQHRCAPRLDQRPVQLAADNGSCIILRQLQQQSTPHSKYLEVCGASPRTADPHKANRPCHSASASLCCHTSAHHPSTNNLPSRLYITSHCSPSPRRRCNATLRSRSSNGQER